MNRRSHWASLSLLLAGVASCEVDGRGLSFSVGALGSASSTGGEETSGGDAPLPQGGSPGQSGNAANGGEAAPGGAPSSTEGGTAQVNGGATQEAGRAGTGEPVGKAGEGAAGAMPGDPDPVEDPEPGNFPCGNLNRNAVDDCQETLAQNSRFDSGALEWSSESGLLQAWQAEDARGKVGSGSLLLSNTNVVAQGTGNTGIASFQCFSAWTGDELELGARVRIAPGQGTGEAGLNLLFFGADGCSGPLLGGQDVALTSETGKWVVVRSRTKIPAGTRSARVRLMVAKPFPQASLEAQFDDVLVVKL